MKDVSKVVKKHLNESRLPGGVQNREETIDYNGDTYELCIWWREEDLRNSAFAMTPYYAYIRKNGVNFAHIDVDNGRPDIFWVKEHTKKLFDKSKWLIRFDKHINKIPFEEILMKLPLDNKLSESLTETFNWTIKFKEVGRKPSETYHSGNLKTEQEVIDFFGLEEDDIEWFEIIKD